MQRGQSLHQSGQLGAALEAFRQALQRDTASLDAANACATVLLALGRTKEAFHLLDFRRAAVLQNADSACNWAILAEQMRLPDLAQQGYEAALHVNPDHLRALNNSALMAASGQRWQVAMEHLGRASVLAPQDVGMQINLCDVCTAAQAHAKALGIIEQAHLVQLGRPDLQLRHAVLLAFNARFEEARQAFTKLSADALALLVSYLESIGIQANRFGWSANHLPPVHQLYLLHAFAAMQVCDWRGNAELVRLAQQSIDTTHAQQLPQDWRDTQFYALMLPLTEAQQGQAMQASRRHYVKRIGQPQAMPWVDHGDGRIHLVFATQNLAEHRPCSQLLAWLSRIDRQKFAVHVMSNSPSPAAHNTSKFKHCTDSFAEIAHLNAPDLVAQIRRKQAHIFIDTAFYTPWCRAELPFFGLAPVHFRHQAWHRHNAGTVQFVIGDAFTHPQADEAPSDHAGALYGPTIRLPFSCWLAADDTQADAQTPSRQALGLPEEAFVLCCRVGAPMIDPASFALWMSLLQALPQAVLWLPTFERSAQNNLQREAQRAGIAPARVVFAQSASRSAQLAQLRQADVFIDTLLFNANHGLVDALRMGVPAISCAGSTLASRLGGSIIKAAGGADGVFDSLQLGERLARQRYRELIVSLGQNGAELHALQLRMQQRRQAEPLFQTDHRVAEWQTAFETMAAQARQGAGFTAFDVPAKT